MLTLDDLVTELSAKMDELKAEVIDREDKLNALFKLTSKVISDFDSETESSIEKLHNRRDEQVLNNTDMNS